MISILSTNGNIINYAGLSTDTKPTENLATGSMFLEIDVTNSTVKSYFFDEVSETWVEAGGVNNG